MAQSELDGFRRAAFAFSLCFQELLGVLDVVHAFPGQRVHKAVVDSATRARGRLRQHRETLEAELRETIPTAHLVALGILRGLVVDVLLRDRHPARRALLCPSFLHPLEEACVVVLVVGLLSLSRHLLRVLLAGETFMVGRR